MADNDRTPMLIDLGTVIFGFLKCVAIGFVVGGLFSHCGECADMSIGTQDKVFYYVWIITIFLLYTSAYRVYSGQYSS